MADDCESGGVLGAGTAARVHAVLRSEVGRVWHVGRADGFAGDYRVDPAGPVAQGFGEEGAGSYQRVEELFFSELMRRTLLSFFLFFFYFAALFFHIPL